MTEFLQQLPTASAELQVSIGEMVEYHELLEEIKWPSIKRAEDGSDDAAPFAREARYFVEPRLRDERAQLRRSLDEQRATQQRRATEGSCAAATVATRCTTTRPRRARGNRGQGARHQRDCARDGGAARGGGGAACRGARPRCHRRRTAPYYRRHEQSARGELYLDSGVSIRIPSTCRQAHTQERLNETQKGGHDRCSGTTCLYTVRRHGRWSELLVGAARSHSRSPARPLAHHIRAAWEGTLGPGRPEEEHRRVSSSVNSARLGPGRLGCGRGRGEQACPTSSRSLCGRARGPGAVA